MKVLCTTDLLSSQLSARPFMGQKVGTAEPVSKGTLPFKTSLCFLFT